jgi:hypothetical protein
MFISLVLQARAGSPQPQQEWLALALADQDVQDEEDPDFLTFINEASGTLHGAACRRKLAPRLA